MTNLYQSQPVSEPPELQNLADTISNLAPGVQTVTFYSQNVGVNQGTYVAYTVQRARRRMLTVEEELHRHAGNALMTERTLIWEFWDSWLQQAGCPNPKPGDYLTDVFGTKYIVVGMEKVALNLQLWSTRCQIRARSALNNFMPYMPLKWSKSMKESAATGTYFQLFPDAKPDDTNTRSQQRSRRLPA